MCLAKNSRICPAQTPQEQLQLFFCIQFCLTGNQKLRNLQLQVFVWGLPLPFLRKWPKHKCELGYEGKSIEIEFAVMQRKSREETWRHGNGMKWEYSHRYSWY